MGERAPRPRGPHHSPLPSSPPRSILRTVLVVAFTLLLAAAPEAVPTVAVLPLRAKSGVTAKQAAGTTALLRDALSDADFLRLVAERKEDQKQADACGVEAPCLARAAFQRGADLLAGGTVSSAKDGLKIELVVVGPDRDEALRTVSATLVGYDVDSVLDRLLREAFAPATLAGALAIEGDCEGARILVDGQEAGACPLAGPVLGLVEGPHTVEVVQPGFQRFRRNVDIRYREVTALKVVLLRDLPTSADTAEPGASAIPWGPIALLAGGGALVATGAVLGALSLRDALDVEARAKAQQLVFPRDSGLMQRGAVLAVAADVAYTAGAAALAGGALWWFLSSPRAEAEAAPPPQLAAPAAGAPTESDLAPALEDLR